MATERPVRRLVGRLKPRLAKLETLIEQSDRDVRARVEAQGLLGEIEEIVDSTIASIDNPREEQAARADQPAPKPKTPAA